MIRHLRFWAMAPAGDISLRNRPTFPTDRHTRFAGSKELSRSAVSRSCLLHWIKIASDAPHTDDAERQFAI
jgi:hypothetical protein